MVCKAQTAAVAHATVRICNAAGRHMNAPQMNALLGVVQAILYTEHLNFSRVGVVKQWNDFAVFSHVPVLRFPP